MPDRPFWTEVANTFKTYGDHLLVVATVAGSLANTYQLRSIIWRPP